jgi:RNA polymerase sigma factor (sigma-70 family)
MGRERSRAIRVFEDHFESHHREDFSKSLFGFWRRRVFTDDKTMNGSRQLLADYAQTRSETAFRELVSCYLDLVYSTALRRVDGDSHRAQDVTQIVFTDLATQAAGISADVMLGGWLHRHTCFVAAKTMRGERRRLAREKEAMNMLTNESALDFALLAPLLDETINRLGEEDRAAILLRFFEQKDFQAVGRHLNSSEDAARMRVNRAVDKLRDLLAQRGIRTTATALSAVIATNAVQAAPAGLLGTISSGALAGTTGLMTATKTIAMTTLQKIAVTAALSVSVGAGIYEAKQAADTRAEVQQLKALQAPLMLEMSKLRAQDAQLSNLVAQAKEQKQLTAAQFNELLKLRGQVTAKQGNAELENDPAVQKAQMWLAKEKKIRDQFELHPEQKIPEMQFLKEEDWLDHARHADVDTSNGMRCAMSNIRATASGIFASQMITMLGLYMADHNQQLPDSALQLADYFHPPLKDPDAILSRYVRVKPNPDIMMTETMVFEQDRATIVDPIDSRVTFSTNTTVWMPGNVAVPLPDELQPAAKAYAEANHQGFMSVYDLKPYATTPEEKAAFEKMIQATNPNR